MLVTSFLPQFPQYLATVSGWLADGSLRTQETVMHGLDQALAAFLAMMRGANVGKMLVKLAR